MPLLLPLVAIAALAFVMKSSTGTIPSNSSVVLAKTGEKYRYTLAISGPASEEFVNSMKNGLYASGAYDVVYGGSLLSYSLKIVHQVILHLPQQIVEVNGVTATIVKAERL